MKKKPSFLPLAPIIITAAVLVTGLYAALLNRPDKITAGSTLKDIYNRYDVSHLTDGTWASWCEGEKDDGKGTRITMTYISTMRINALYIKNGFGLRKYFGLNNRVKRMKITAGNGPTVVITLEDSPGIQRFGFSPELTGKVFTYQILETYRGSKFNDTCIAEIAFSPASIPDTEAMPRFKSFSFNMPEGKGLGRRIILYADGKVGGEHERGHQLSTTIVSGTWKKNPDGSVRIEYTWLKPVSMGKSIEDYTTEPRKASLVLKHFGIDAIIDDRGNRAQDLSWE